MKLFDRAGKASEFKVGDYVYTEKELLPRKIVEIRRCETTPGFLLVFKDGSGIHTMVAKKA
jgi:hypothetical protein